MSGLEAKMHQIHFPLELCPKRRWGSWQFSYRPPCVFKGPTSKGRKRKGGKGREMKGKWEGRREDCRFGPPKNCQNSSLFACVSWSVLVSVTTTPESDTTLSKYHINNTRDTHYTMSLSQTTHPVPSLLLLVTVRCVSSSRLLTCQTVVAVNTVHWHVTVECWMVLSCKQQTRIVTKRKGE